MKKSLKILLMSLAVVALSLAATAVPGKKHKAHAEGVDQAAVSQTAVSAQNGDNSASAQWWGGGWRGGGWRGGGWRGGWGRPFYGGWRGGYLGWPYYGGWYGGYGGCGGGCGF
jgi:hypothetical protein